LLKALERGPFIFDINLKIDTESLIEDNVYVKIKQYLNY
jgi:hypothetical protein